MCGCDGRPVAKSPAAGGLGDDSSADRDAERPAGASDLAIEQRLGRRLGRAAAGLDRDTERTRAREVDGDDLDSVGAQRPDPKPPRTDRPVPTHAGSGRDRTPRARQLTSTPAVEQPFGAATRLDGLELRWPPWHACATCCAGCLPFLRVGDRLVETHARATRFATTGFVHPDRFMVYGARPPRRRPAR